MVFADRTEAGRLLAEAIAGRVSGDLVVLGLPRGGVPVAFPVATALNAPLDVLVVRKLGLPYRPEVAMGAIGEGGVRVLDQRLLAQGGVSAAEVAAVERRERAELARRVARYRGGRPPVPLTGRTVVLVDDGLATGSTARAACQVARARGAARVVLAVPVGPPDVVAALSGAADEVVCLDTPTFFLGIGQFYDDFGQTSDEEVLGLLDRAARRRVPGGGLREEEVRFTVDGVHLAGRLAVPAAAAGVVLFAHGSGSSRHSPRNRFVAEVIERSGLGTLLMDLLTPTEERHRDRVFDVELLAARLAGATGWLRGSAGLADLPLGYFGASTGAAAALWAAADLGLGVAAVVSRGGRPDLAAARLGQVRAPTLLVVGGRDDVVLDLNRAALAMLRCEARLEIVPGATHLFEEPGTLATAARLAGDWFVSHLTSAPAAV